MGNGVHCIKSVNSRIMGLLEQAWQKKVGDNSKSSIKIYGKKMMPVISGDGRHNGIQNRYVSLYIVTMTHFAINREAILFLTIEL